MRLRGIGACCASLGLLLVGCATAARRPAVSDSKPKPTHGASERPEAAGGAHGEHHVTAHAEHHGHHAATANHRFDDPERWAKVFDDPERDAWQKPDVVLDFLGLSPDAVVADLGAGTGYFSVRLAQRVPRGKVFAVDVEPKLLDHLSKRAAKAKLENIATVLAEPNDPKLPRDLDLVLVVDTYHHISERVPYFERVLRRLKAQGRVVIVDFRLGELPVGPPDDHKISQDQAHTEMEAAGFQLCAELKSLPYQYVLSFGARC